MTISIPLDVPGGTTPPQPTIATPPPGPPPSIAPNRRRLDNRFPVLAFSIRTYGRPYLEVLLTVDRMLFDPAAAARRTPANFYAGRQDGGLIHATAEETAYVVPAAVLKRFAEARPRPAEIFYTVAAYDAPDGVPVLAHPPAMLATTAPSVLLGGDFEAKTMAAVLSIPAEKLESMAATPPGAFAPMPNVLGTPELDDDGIAVGEASSWSAEGEHESATDQAAAAWAADVNALSLDSETRIPDEPPPEMSLADEYAFEDAAPEAEGLEEDWEEPAAQAYESPGDTDDYAQEYGTQDDDYDEEYSEAYAADEPYEGEASPAGLAYEDGFEDDATAASTLSSAADSTFPLGAAEPAPLGDADEERYADEFGYEDETYGVPESPYTGYGNGNGATALQSTPTSTVAPTPSAPLAPVAPPAPAAPLDIPAKIAIVTKIGRKFEASAGFAGINADSEFSNPRMPQHGRWHVGLSYGFVQFSQDSGMLGKLLEMMRLRDPAKFREIFGPQSEDLVHVTTQQGPSGRSVPGGRSVRVQPVGGIDLWQEPWISRFRAAGAHPPFQAAQNELAVRAYLDPMLGFAAGFGMNSERALAMVVDRTIQQGTGGARRWLTGAIGPIRTDAQRQQALGALGVAGIREFQQASGLPADGDFGPLTHAAMTGALRRLGPASPVPIPTRQQNMDAIVARADGENVGWKARPRAVRTDPDFADAELSWTSPAAAGP